MGGIVLNFCVCASLIRPLPLKAHNTAFLQDRGMDAEEQTTAGNAMTYAEIEDFELDNVHSSETFNLEQNDCAQIGDFHHRRHVSSLPVEVMSRMDRDEGRELKIVSVEQIDENELTQHFPHSKGSNQGMRVWSSIKHLFMGHNHLGGSHTHIAGKEASYSKVHQTHRFSQSTCHIASQHPYHHSPVVSSVSFDVFSAWLEMQVPSSLSRSHHSVDKTASWKTVHHENKHLSKTLNSLSQLNSTKTTHFHSHAGIVSDCREYPPQSARHSPVPHRRTLSHPSVAEQSPPGGLEHTTLDSHLNGVDEHKQQVDGNFRQSASGSQTDGKSKQSEMSENTFSPSSGASGMKSSPQEYDEPLLPETSTEEVSSPLIQSVFFSTKTDCIKGDDASFADAAQTAAEECHTNHYAINEVHNTNCLLLETTSNQENVTSAASLGLCDVITNGFLRQRLLMLFLAGAFLIQLASNVPALLTPSYAYLHGVTKDQSAQILSIYGLMNTAGRLGAGLLVYLGCGSLRVHNLGTLLAGIACFIFPLCTSFPTITACVAVHALFLGAFAPLQPVILAEYLGVERLASVFGTMCFVKAFANIAGAPLAGAVYGLTGLYTIPVAGCGAVLVLAALLHELVPCCMRPRDCCTRPRD